MDELIGMRLEWITERRHRCTSSNKHGRPIKSPVAKIPWLPQPSEKIEFEKSKFYKLMSESCSTPVAKQKRELYRILNETFPFYLPKRHHAMECKELHLKCPNRQYWANAGHFMYATHAHDHQFYGSLDFMICYPDPSLESIFSQPVFNMSLKHEVLKYGSAECETAAQYLLEPWILLQLLTQPIIMYQWAIALLAETTRTRVMWTEIKHLHFSDEVLICVEKLGLMISNLNELAHELLTLFNKFLESSYKYNPHVHTRKVIKKLHLMLKLYLPTISFVVSDECKNVINTLKKMAQNQPTQSTSNGENVPSEDSKAQKLKQDKQNVSSKNLFALSYWQCDEMDSFYNKLNIEPTIENSKLGYFQKVMIISWDFLKNVISKLFSSTEINQEENDAVLEDLNEMVGEEDGEILSIALEFNSKSPCLQDSDKGVIYNMICLYNDAYLAQSNARNQENTPLVEDGPEISLQSIKETLCKAMEPCKEDFVDHVQNKIQSECFSSNWESLPDYKENGAEKIAEHFQERIKTLVFKMTLEHNMGLKKTGPYTYYPEVLFIQYLLPCFVALFLDLDTDLNASQTKKEKYLQFLHELIICYENRMYSQDLSEEFRFPFTVFIRSPTLWIHMHTYLQDAMAFFQYSFSGTKTIKQMKKFLIFMAEHNEKMNCRGPHPSYGWSTQKWHMYMLMFLSRIRYAAEKVGWLGDSAAFCPLEMIAATKPDDAINVRDFEIFHQLLRCAHFNSEKERNRENRKAKFKVPKDLMLAAKYVSLPQLMAVSISMLVANLELKNLNVQQICRKQGPAFPLDPTAALWHLSKGDKWLAKIALLEKVMTKEREDPTLVTLEFAKSNKCYDFVLPSLTQDGKVKMRHPGEITFFPIKHCRWCGLADVKEFRLCPECKENVDYPDVNFYCSEKCEKVSLEKQHTEEHARFLMLKCGI